MSEHKTQGEQDQTADESEGSQFRVDEGWKQRVAEERERQQAAHPNDQQAKARAYPKPDTRVFFAGLYTQTLMCLGEIENPVTNRKEANLAEAQYLIDTIDMLRHKMLGNLSADEQQYLDDLLHDLRMRYVGTAGRCAPQAEAAAQEGQDKT